jgi:hypothetical protein
MTGQRHTTRSAPRRTGPVPVGAALRSASQPLDRAVRRQLEPWFGRDLSTVRVHTDEQAAESARAVGAAAYTVGTDVVFGRGQFDPGSAAGRQLLAHELTHVVQQDGHSVSGQVEVGPAEGELEQEAAGQASRVAEAPARRPASGRRSAGRAVLQRSLLGGLAGGLIGAVGGAVIGGLLGGPVGAVVGGLAGLVGGALIGDAATTRKRPLTVAEIAYAKDVFKDSVDYSQITITRDSMFSAGAPKTLGNTIHLRSDWGHFIGDSMQLTQGGQETLIHEMGHVWQYQNGGLAYIPESLWAQFKGFIGAGSRGAAYDWREADRAGLPWEKWNPEQQAAAIEDYNIKLRKSKDGTATLVDLSELSTLLPYLRNVWARQGAPHFETPDLKATVPL